ncbi:UPF0175 family protein [Candidatus Woesearchaeota archaeon]|nr:UPF0175 family protein [Candidatus Woesearchaeota archaeon]
MTEAIGIRLEEDFVKVLNKISKEESLDRSAILRKLLKLGYSDYLKQKAKQKYLVKKVTLSEAAKIARITIWEMQKYLIEEGYKSEYSIDDLKEDMSLLN